MRGERVILARRTDGFVPYRWTRSAPRDLNDADIAELVTYDLTSLEYQLEHWTDEWQTDDD